MAQRRTTSVRGHRRTTASGRTTKVRSHSRSAAWRQAGAAWAGAGVSGVTTLAVVLQFGFTLISTIFLVLTVLLGMLGAKATARATRPQRRMRAKVKARPRSTGARRRRR